MYSTNSPKRSNAEGQDTLPIIIQTTHSRPSSNCYHNIPVALEGHGATWDGNMETMTRTSLRMVIEGCPLVVRAQSLQLHILSQQFDIEILGVIEKITPLGDTAEGRWARVQLDVSYDSLDDLRWQRVKLILRDALSHSATTCLRGEVIPLDAGSNLWKMRSTPVHLPLPTYSNVKELSIPIVSTPVEIPNTKGHIIRAHIDTPCTPLPAQSPVVILSPGYGETKREYIMLAYYFASNGFHVLRYDHTHHVGISDGDHLDTTLTTMREDLAAVVSYIEQQWPSSNKGIVATSLSGRVAVKTVAEDVSVDFLFLITPIVDVRKTLQAVHQEDLIATYTNGQHKGVTNVLGFNVELDHWLADAVAGQYSDLETTYRDLSRIQVPVVMVSAEHDAWVEPETTHSVAKVFDEQLREWIIIPGGLHRVLESPKQAKAVYRELVQLAQAEVALTPRPLSLREPTRKAIGRQNKLEREQKKTGQPPVELMGFWKDYLEHFHYIVNFSDYQQLLDHIVRLLGPVKSGEKVLDAGCGNGNFGLHLLRNEQTHHNQGTTKTHRPFEYVGIDFVPTALQHARRNYQTSYLTPTLRDHDTNQQATDETSSAFHCVDLNKPLPFQDGTFDKVVSNLVLGYLESPANTIRELMRVLTPGGSLVLTNLKPNSDLSRIFTNFVQETSSAEEIEEAKQLLNNSGKIREAEGEGLFHFPDAEELEQLIHAASKGSETKVFSTFANQAYIVSVKKKLAQKKPLNTPTRNILKAA